MIFSRIFPILQSASSALRIPALATYIAGLAASVIGFFTLWFTKKVAIQLTIISLILGLTVTLFGAFNLLITGIEVVMPDQMQQVLLFITPSNFWLCYSSICAAKILRWVWVWKVHFIEMYANGN